MLKSHYDLFDHSSVWQIKEDIEKIDTGYYEGLFTSSDPRRDQIDVVIEGIDERITYEMNNMLARQCTKDEIY